LVTEISLYYDARSKNIDQYRVLDELKQKATQQIRTDTRSDNNAQLLYYFTQ